MTKAERRSRMTLSAKSWGNGYRAGYAVALEDALAALNHHKVNEADTCDYYHGSAPCLDIVAARIRALKPGGNDGK